LRPSTKPAKTNVWPIQPLRTLDAICADILAVEKEAEGLLDELLKGGPK
jgi:hypothetical protein